MEKEEIADYLDNGCQILTMLNRYQQAYDLIKRGIHLDYIKPESVIKISLKLIVLSINLGKQIPPEVE